MPVTVKICGVRTVEDARAAADHGADYVGLNFHPPSPRYLPPDDARALTAALPGVRFVGVFVDAAREEMAAIAAAVGLVGLQFHGDEPPELCSGWPYTTIKTIHARADDDVPARAARYVTDHVLIDSFVPGIPGGTGVPLDAAALAGLDPARLFVAGGLTPERVAAIVRRVRPFGVDVASGVESSPGKKDHGKIEEFIRRAKAA